MRKVDEKKFVRRLSLLFFVFLVIGGLWRIFFFLDPLIYYVVLLFSTYLMIIFIFYIDEILRKFKQVRKKTIRTVKKIRKRKKRYIKIPLPF